jgi:quaternary ammonium compound-resistance protein SugE
MELVLVVTVAGLVGLAVRYALPGRSWHGIAVLPALGVITGSLGWAFAVWVGLDATAIWSWVVALTLSVAGAIAGAIIIPRRREAAHDALWAQLTKG